MLNKSIIILRLNIFSGVRILISTVFFIFFLTSYSQSPVTFKYSEGLAGQKITKDNKSYFGFVSSSGKVSIPHAYDTIYTNFKHGFAGVGKNKKAGVIDTKGKVIIPFEYKEIGEVNKNIIPVKSFGGCWGFYNDKGEIISDTKFQNYRYGGKHKIIVQKDGKWGMINSKGEALIECNYKWIQQVGDKNYKVTHVNQWFVRDPSNKELFNARFDSVRYVGEGLYKYCIIGRCGFVDSKGSLTTGTDYEDIGSFRNGLVKVRKNLYGVIDTKYKVVVPFEYEQIIIDSLYIRVKSFEKSTSGILKEKWGLYDLKGNKLIHPKYTQMNALSNGLIAAMKEDGTWGYIDAKGNTEVIFRYNSAEDFHNGIARVKVPYSMLNAAHYAIIDKNGDYVVSPADYENYVSGMIRVGTDRKSYSVVPKEMYSYYSKVSDRFIRIEKNGKYGMVDNKGAIILPAIYDYISVPSNTGLMVVEKSGKAGVVDSNGIFTMKLSNRYDKIFGYRDGYSKFLLKEKYGFINSHGDVYVSPQYSETGELSDGMVNVRLRGKWAFVDYKENLKVQPYYEDVRPYKNGVAVVKENNLWNIINKEGKVLHQQSFDQISETGNGNYLLKYRDKYGMADQNGREVLAPKYEQVIEMGKDYVLVKKNGLWGVLDYRENFILPIEFDVILFEPSGKVFISGKTGRQEEMIIK